MSPTVKEVQEAMKERGIRGHTKVNTRNKKVYIKEIEKYDEHVKSMQKTFKEFNARNK